MKLTIRILRNEEGDYTAVCPTLPGCVSRGPTREEATDRLDEAIRGYIAAVSNFVPEKVTHEVTEAH
jgi:predicted RNase H-like HicB family nuclease